MTYSRTRRREWIATGALALLSLVLVAGLGIAVYLTWHHENKLYGDPSVALGNCPQTETVDCEAVNTSAWSELVGVPVAALAVPAYLLVLGLLWGARRQARYLAYAFGVGVLAALFSGWLYYVSKVEIGFLCLWCVRLYGINLSIPALACVAARRSPAALAREALSDLRAWGRPARIAALGFAALLAATVALQRGYRASLESESGAARAALLEEHRRLAPETGSEPIPTGPAGAGPGPAATTAGLPSGGPLPPPVAAPPQAPAGPPPTADASGNGRVPSPLRRFAGDGAGLRLESFDLNARIGRGRPLGLIFWSPGYKPSERGLAEMAQYLASSAPGIETYAVAAPRKGLNDLASMESFAMLPLPGSLPLLLDEDLRLTAALGVRESPSLFVFDGAGRMVLPGVVNPRQRVLAAAGPATVASVLRQIAAGESLEPITKAGPYYPGSGLVGFCAPGFALEPFGGGAPHTFGGRSPGGRPTLIFFWSSTCKHCQAEIPGMLDWLRRNPGRLDVVSVTTIKPERAGQPSHRDITAAYIRQQQIPWIVLEDSEGIVNELYGIVSTPTTFFVAASGAVGGVWFHPQGADLDAAMERELGRLRGLGRCAPAPSPTPARLDFTVAGPAGRRADLKTLLDQPALVHFWATWCAPCIKELPGLVRLRERLEREGVGRVILVSVEDESAAGRIASFERKYGMDLKSYHAPAGGLAERLTLSYSVPRTFVVASGGGVLEARYGEQNWDDAALVSRVISRLKNAGGRP